MKITEQTNSRLVLSGVPGGFGWMVFATALGVALTTAVVIGLVYLIAERQWFGVFWTGVGLLIAQAIFWMGAITLAVGRERLELDLSTKTGRYSVRSPIVETEKPFEFDLAHLHSVTLERASEHRPGSTRPQRRADRDAQILRCRLRTTTPRRAVVLDETENGREERVRELARQVTSFLGTEPTDVG